MNLLLTSNFECDMRKMLNLGDIVELSGSLGFEQG